MKSNFFTKFIFLFFILITSSVYSQKGSFRGFVYDSNTTEPIPFVNIFLEGTSYGTSTNYDGFFLIQDLDPGKYTVRITSLGYDTVRFEFKLKANQIFTRKFNIEDRSINLNTVNITADRQAAKTETRTSVVKVTPKQIDAIPSIGGQSDLAQYIQVVPGVVFTGDQGGQLYIRGGSPIQNKVLLDGMVIYNPFHSIGLFSVFDTEIMRSTDVYTGGFGAEYGGRVSSVMDIKTRSGNTNRFKGKIGANPFGASVTIEGPTKKILGIPNSSFILSAKNSYLSSTSKSLYSYVNKDGLPFDYTDIYGKFSIGSKTGSAFNIFGFRFEDEVKGYKKLADFNWVSNGFGSNFILIPTSSTSIIEGVLAYSDYEVRNKEFSGAERFSNISGFNIGLNISSFGDKLENKTGFEIKGMKTNAGLISSYQQAINIEENTTEFGAFTSFKLNFNKLLIEPGLRLQYYSSLGEISAEPRLSAKLLLTDFLRFKFATGIYSQNLISTRSEKDIVNLFNGLMTAPQNIPKKFGDEDITKKIQKAKHLIVGMELDLGENITTNVEGYIKDFSQLSAINHRKMYSSNDVGENISPVLYRDYSVHRGFAKGVDFTLKFENKDFYIWAVYSLSYVDREAEDESGRIVKYPTHFDRRHNVNLLGVYRLGDKKQWEVSLRWNYGSAFPFTQLRGYVENVKLGSEGINTDYTAENGEVYTLFSDTYNGGRLIPYHRLDANIKKKFYFSANTRLEVDLSVTNLYDRENIFYIDALNTERVNQLPILPSLGINLFF
ncbi:MAG: carboxypeptidase-like regulatory domain-containing protein [Bacteroidales bacterium]